jgi:cytidylate kinase
MSEERLQKILARAGFGSRRSCERLISQGHLTVDGLLVTELGATADPRASVICVDGQPIRAERSRYLVLHKPAGYLSNPDPRAGHPSWLDLVSVPERLFPVGRLDLESEGLLLLTNDGDLAQLLTHPRFEHPKTYLVQCEGIPNPRKLRRLRHGVMLEDGPTAPAEVTLLRRVPHQINAQSMQSRTAPTEARGRETSGRNSKPTCWLKVSLREGRKRQLRRMVARLGHRALRVIRIGMGPLELGQLPAGKWRELWPAEIEALRAAVSRGVPAEEMGDSQSISAPEATTTGISSTAGKVSPSRGRRLPPPRTNQVRAPGSSRVPQIIAVDGPSASGKSTVGRLLAHQLGYLYFDTGVMYRAVARVALNRGIPVAKEAAISALARRIVLEVLPPTVSDGRDVTVLADGIDITWDIRSRDVELAVSPVSSYAGVREALRSSQRRVGLAGKVVMVGRDIGTVVLPEADLKIYLDASLKVRAQRRYLERLARGETLSLEDVLAAMKRRDEIDSSREHGPLIAAPDAIVIDTTNFTVEQVVERVLQLIEKKRGSNR